MINIKTQTVKGWTTHMPMLIKVLAESKGPVCEVGGGPFSTPLLHWICKMQNRKLVTYENEPEFYKMCRGFQSRLHSIRFLDDWDKMDFNTHWGVVFIDHHPPERRVIDVLNFKDKADFIIMHDTEKENKYGLQRAFPEFKYFHTWKDCKPWTSVFSNFKDLTFLK